jgi:superfamily II DNA or RNA helicase/uncharacterized Zn finger protein
MQKFKIFYNQKDVKETYDYTTFSRGHSYYREGRVVKYKLSRSGNAPRLKISGSVQGSGRKIYQSQVAVNLLHDKEFGNFIDFDEEFCSCPVGYGCKHVVALLLQVATDCDYEPMSQKKDFYNMLQKISENQQNTMTSATQLSTLMQSLSSLQQEKKTSTTEFIVYLLSIKPYRKDELCIKPVLTRYLKNGGYGAPKKYSKNSTVSDRTTTDKDRKTLALLESLSSFHASYDVEFKIQFRDVGEILTELLEEKKLFWENVSSDPLVLGDERDLTLEWKINPDGGQKLTYHIDSVDDQERITLLPIRPLWYYDSATQTCGLLKTDIPANIILSLTSLAPLAPDAIKEAQQQFKKLLPIAKTLPMPIELAKAGNPKELEKRLVLHLFGDRVAEKTNYHFFGKKEMFAVPLVELQFFYNQHKVTLNDSASTVQRFQDNALVEIQRDKTWEQSCVDKLIDINVSPLVLSQDYAVSESNKFAFLLHDESKDDNVTLEKLEQVKQLAAANQWQLDIADSFPLKVIDEIEEWYSDLDEGSGIDWFSLSLGVVVNGEKVNLLPLLVNLIRSRFHSLSPEEIAAMPDDTPCPLKLPSGHYISVPFSRVRNILYVLCELYDSKALDENGALRLSQLQAGLLIEIEKALGAVRLRWFGGERLRELGKKLNDFRGIQSVEPASDFKANLRPYQQQGLNWLQFLREFQLGGILADDMGLGKTIQTLAHLSVEKAQDRLRKTSLLIAPTSLVYNWANEAEKFAPNLSLLVLHGAERKQKFDDIQSADLVITTYPLVLRDKTILCQEEFYYLILDEAHTIKNAQAKSTQIILQLKAEHRLCLTGTPMENHLGELWSLFHFVLPGLLGNNKQFKALFRTPIEKHGDTLRYAQLLKRINPFLLRRRKDEVVKELPQKTEIIRHIELEGAQRDLYESVRLSMESQVRDAISQKGLARSQIIILDALLKLRQICCAPTLLKLTSVKAKTKSAKLDDLMEFLPELIEEGRRVLLFSSFTSMLALIEKELTKRAIAYVKLTGQTKDRKTVINAFQNGEVPLFLISLKAGGVGINLTTADTVIHYDPWWNPAAEQQATDRAHRIGQTKPVFVYKLITKGTVEEKILEMQNKKRELIAGIIEQKQHAKAQLTQDDLSALFQPLE